MSLPVKVKRLSFDEPRPPFLSIMTDLHRVWKVQQQGQVIRTRCTCVLARFKRRTCRGEDHFTFLPHFNNFCMPCSVGVAVRGSLRHCSVIPGVCCRQECTCCYRVWVLPFCLPSVHGSCLPNECSCYLFIWRVCNLPAYTGCSDVCFISH